MDTKPGQCPHINCADHLFFKCTSASFLDLLDFVGDDTQLLAVIPDVLPITTLSMSQPSGTSPTQRQARTSAADWTTTSPRLLGDMLQGHSYECVLTLGGFQ